MNQTEALLKAIDSLWSELPALVGGDWSKFEPRLRRYLKQLKEEPQRRSIALALILDLFSKYPRAHQRLIEFMADFAEEEMLSTRTVRSVPTDTLLSSVTRYSDVSLPHEAEVGVHIALVVRVTVEPVSDEAKKLELQVPEGERVVEVTVIACPNGLELVGSNLRHLCVPLTADSDPVHFELVGRQVGEASVTVDFFQGERYLGSVTAETYVKAPGTVVHPTPMATRGALNLAEAWEAPDLLIRIYESRGTDGTPRYRFELTSHMLGLFHYDAGEVGLPQRAEAWVDELMKALTEMAQTESTASDKVLARFGVQLYDHLCPPKLKDFYWSQLHEREDIQTVLLVTSEPWVPWEMVKPWRRIGNDIVEAPHWCERFIMGRWLNGQQPPLTLPRGEVAVIAPRDVDIDTHKEVDMLKRIGLSVREVPARLKDVLEFLESDGCPGVHVISHGIFNLNNVDHSELWLERMQPPYQDRREKLRPSLINGRCLQFGRAEPLVFLNACHCGRSDFTYWGLGGWAKAFVERAGCSAFIAPLWEVEDERALHFAKALYLELRKGKPIGEALLTARQTIKQTDNPTWLAYCLYAHPKASLRRI